MMPATRIRNRLFPNNSCTEIQSFHLFSLLPKDGLTALHCAARDGRDRCVELLLVYGAPITAKTTVRIIKIDFYKIMG